jgi:hypothetical protein
MHTCREMHNLPSWHTVEKEPRTPCQRHAQAHFPTQPSPLGGWHTPLPVNQLLHCHQPHPIQQIKTMDHEGRATTFDKKCSNIGKQ